MERVEGVELGEAFLEGLLRRELNEVHDLSCICTTESTNKVIKLCEAGSYTYTRFVSPELRSLRATERIPKSSQLRLQLRVRMSTSC